MARYGEAAASAARLVEEDGMTPPAAWNKAVLAFDSKIHRSCSRALSQDDFLPLRERLRQRAKARWALKVLMTAHVRGWREIEEQPSSRRFGGGVRGQ
jgi:hypothetical protein